MSHLTFWHSTFCPIRHFSIRHFVSFDVISVRQFVPFDVLSLSTFFTFDILSVRRFVAFNILSVRHFVSFNILAFGIVSHSTFCRSTFCPFGVCYFDILSVNQPTWFHLALLSWFHARCRSSFQLHNQHSRLLGRALWRACNLTVFINSSTRPVVHPNASCHEGPRFNP